ncbi:MAG: PqqD family protein [Thaumarchaeota archaeon]|nr:PqqD family protein [Candidatus Calditenuaceae archaeon]MCX8203268.1 PqqD family protein [Nitrososphaeria archaeon]MDW8043020.1 PqqD family protein [Nitrososphaerota archaeon]
MASGERKLTRRGQLVESPEGELMLVNESGVAYLVNESVVAVWSFFEDKTVEEVVLELSQELAIEPSEIRDAIRNLADQLIEAELLG